MNFIFMRSLGRAGLLAILTSCASSPPRDAQNICSIFEERRAWYKAAKNAEQRWNSHIPVAMAILYQESGFNAKAKPARDRFLWIIPGRRPSSAYGYAQALDGTWNDYETKSGNSRASRANFADAIDFVGWYNANSNAINGISPLAGRDLYYAYHEGNGGFNKGTYRDKQWLIEAAGQVQSNATRFDAQLNSCRANLEKSWFQRLIS
ncbi:MAG: transglycosylase SLT domain-containing protein [Pseudohongiellaceae bacterium]